MTNPLIEMDRLKAACAALCEAVADHCPTDTWLDTQPCDACVRTADEACGIDAWARSAEHKARLLRLLCRTPDCDGRKKLNVHGLCPRCAQYACEDCGMMLAASERADGECPGCDQGTRYDD